jgi:hypothetical protein
MANDGRGRQVIAFNFAHEMLIYVGLPRHLLFFFFFFFFFASRICFRFFCFFAVPKALYVFADGGWWVFRYIFSAAF